MNLLRARTRSGAKGESSQRPDGPVRIVSHRAAWAVLVISLAATAGGWFVSQMYVEMSARTQFEESARQIQHAINEHMLMYENLLHGAVGLYAASISVQRAEWRAYTQVLPFNSQLPGIEGLAYVARVPRNELPAFLQATRADGAPDFSVKNAGTDNDLMVVKYIEPEDEFKEVLGTDLAADPVCRAAAEAACDTGKAAISGRILLRDSKQEEQTGFLMLLPTYRQGVPHATVEERRAAIQGWICARLVVDKLMQGVLERKPDAMSIQLYDGPDITRDRLMFDEEADWRAAHPDYHSSFSENCELKPAGGTWTLRVTSSPGYESSIPHTINIVVGVGGLMISLLLFVLARSISQTRERALAMAADMTAALRTTNEQLQHERFLLHTLMESLPDRIYFKDLQSRFIRNSRAHLDRFGLAEEREAIGKSDFDFFTEEHARQAFEDEQQLIRTGQPITKEERETWPDGSVTWALSTKLPLRDENDHIIGTFGISRDITGQKRAEEAMLRAKEAAEEANRTKSQFLANMSHELRTPLNSVIGFASILLKNKVGNLQASDLNFLERIQANGKHLLSLINQILDLSKIEAQRVELQLTPVHLDELVRETIAQQEGLVRDRPVELLAELPDLLEPIETDAGKLKQVIINLVGNALKFTEEGSVTVRVLADASSHRPTRVEVVDTGIGIPQEKLSAVFEAFQQADASTARKYGGTGLGLTISQALCNFMGYRIEVASEVGKGSTFSIVFGPTAPGSRGPSGTERIGKTTPRDKAPSRPPTALAGRLVLVVDDDLDSRVLLTHMIEEFGCQVISASSGEQGLRMAREFRPHLITVDLMMPRMSGSEVIGAIKADPELSDTPVVVVSIVAGENRGRILGAVDVLQKPIVREELLAVLQRNLPPNNPRVLVVDDEEDSRRLIACHLEGQSVEIKTVASGREALRVMGTWTPELIFLDLMMPEMDGLTFLNVIRANPRYRDLPVVVVTAKELTRAEVEQLRMQTQDVLKKAEVFERDLRSIVERLLKRAHPEVPSASVGKETA